MWLLNPVSVYIRKTSSSFSSLFADQDKHPDLQKDEHTKMKCIYIDISTQLKVTKVNQVYLL